MKKAVMLTAVFLILTSTLAAAHPPNDLDVSYDLADHLLLVKMKHVVRNPTDHRIFRIVIVKNGKDEETKYFPKQTTAEMFDEAIPYDAKPGDELTVRAYCNKAGTETETISVKDE